MTLGELLILCCLLHSIRHLTNFRRLVLCCIDSYDSESRRILQHFSKSTRFSYFCTAQISKFQQKIRQNFWRNEKKFISFHSRFSMDFAIFRRNFDEILPEFQRTGQEMTNCLEILKKMREKFGKWQKFPEFVRNFIRS